MMEVFVANFGRGNALWGDCKRSSVISTFSGQDTHELWRRRSLRAAPATTRCSSPGSASKTSSFKCSTTLS